MEFIDFLDQDLIQTELSDGTKFQVIEELLNLAVDANRVHDREQALKDLIERERYLSTGFENGLAVPHAKTEAVSEVVLVFGMNRGGIEFDSLDGKPTHFVFLLLSPMDTSGPHIQTLALLARNFQSAGLLERLKDIQDKMELIEVFKEFK